MIEVFGDLWAYHSDALVITTNGTVKVNGECVMGRGCAAEAKAIWPKLPAMLGQHISEAGNVPKVFHLPALSNLDCEHLVVSFPVKHHWMEKADPVLIKESAIALKRIADEASWKVCVMPRPGCGNGGLKWEQVKPILAPILDDRFHVIDFLVKP